jgi:hypothetical protein
MRLSLKESRMLLLNATNLDRKSGIRGLITTGRSSIEGLSISLSRENHSQDTFHWVLRNIAICDTVIAIGDKT